MRYLIILLSLTSLSGCVGLAVGSFGTFENKKESFSLSNERGRFGYGNNRGYTQQEVLDIWGEPDESFHKGRCTVFSYHDGFSWSGVGAFILIVPIPLLVPSGNDEVRIYFRNEESIAAVSEYGEVTGTLGYMCGSNECGFNAGAVNTDKTRKAEITECM